MSTSGKLRQAEERGAKGGAEKASGRQATSTHAAAEHERETVRHAKPGRTGIISVNGRDVGHMRCTGGRHTV